jgi:type II secretory pathway pseudopilin PulG
MSLVESLMVVALVSVLGGLCVASVSTGTALMREEAAGRFLVMQVRQARQEAVRRAETVGIRFEASEAGAVRFRVYADGNGNGLRTRDIQDGLDTPLGPSRGLEDDFGNVSFGVSGPAPPIEAGGERLDTGDDPIRVGASRILSFSATGRGSSGTLYVCGRGGAGTGTGSGGSGGGAAGGAVSAGGGSCQGGQQFAVRVFGQTGRVRLLQFRTSDGQWIER